MAINYLLTHIELLACLASGACLDNIIPLHEAFGMLHGILSTFTLAFDRYGREREMERWRMSKKTKMREIES